MARKKGQKINGWINLNKPYGIGSTQALGKVRRLMDAQKAGHAGTLDPLASGVLPIALGEATKFISYIQDGMKEYAFTVTWGEQRDTDDLEGQVTHTSEKRPSLKEINAILPRFTGVIEQTPPQFSAVKIDGHRAYDLARDGQEFEIQSREIYIEMLNISDHRDDETDFRTICGKGTYIRSLARDFAHELGTFGYISALKRLKSAGFAIENAISLDRLESLSNSAGLNQALIPLETALDDIPALAVKEEEASRLRNGQILTFISRPDFARLEGLERNGSRALATCKGKAVAIVQVEGPDVKPVRVINN